MLIFVKLIPYRMKSLLKYLPVLALCGAVSCRTAHEGPAYLDKSLSAEERAADLLERLTLEEPGRSV